MTILGSIFRTDARCDYHRYGELCDSLYFIPQELLDLEELWYARCRAVGNQGIPFLIVAVVIGVDGSIPMVVATAK